MVRDIMYKLNNNNENSRSTAVKSRCDIPSESKWNIEDMYSDESLWNSDLEKALKLAEDFSEMQGKVCESDDSLFKALSLRDEMYQLIEKVYVFSRMKRDEDNSNEQYQSLCDKAQVALSKISTKTAFFVPEILEHDEAEVMNMVKSNDNLKIYTFMFEDIFKDRPHMLSLQEEELMAQMSQLNSATNNIFTMLNNADISFEPIEDKNGEKLPLSHGNYISYLEKTDKHIRSQAYNSMYTSYKNLINTIATAYSYNTKTDAILSKIRKYNSSMEQALSGDNVSVDIYNNLVDVINDRLPVLHKYMEVRKRALNLDVMNMCDVYLPIVQIPDDASCVSGSHIDFKEAVEIMEKALAPLGDEYIENMKKGIDNRWVDIYENQGKTSGAYSFGSYDSMPYILMNYSNTLKDVFTLVHEMGHSMHSFYTRKTQPYIYGDHSIFTAEVASTVNENLLVKYLLSEEVNPEMKKYLINYHIEEFRTTVFRQTMFAEFEKWTHEQIEKGEALTAESMSAYYLDLNKKYFGEAVEMDELIKYEWARIPHFYNAFYVYKYATGYCAAAAISDLILEKGPDDYLEFLKSGNSNYPIPLLKIAGVDMASSEPINRALDVFEALVNELDKLV